MTTKMMDGSQQSESYSYGPHNVMTKAGEWNYHFNADGNLSSKTHVSAPTSEIFTWDAHNRMVGFREEQAGHLTKDIAYDYDASGRRIKRTDKKASATREWVWDGISELVTKADGAIDNYYVNGLGGNIYRIDKQGQKYFYLKDVLGNTLMVTDQWGDMVAVYQYDEYGACTNYDHDPMDDRSFTGKRYDEDAGLYYFQARWYEAGAACFICRDKFNGFINNSNTINLYRYGISSPLNNIDVLGLSTIDITITRTEYRDDRALGSISVNGANIGATLEKPWKSNAENISSVPEDIYNGVLGMYTSSNGKKYETIEVVPVPGRSGIWIHVGNYPAEINGCILIGEAIDKNGNLKSSKAAWRRLMKIVKKTIEQDRAKGEETEIIIDIGSMQE